MERRVRSSASYSAVALFSPTFPSFFRGSGGSFRGTDTGDMLRGTRDLAICTSELLSGAGELLSVACEYLGRTVRLLSGVGELLGGVGAVRGTYELLNDNGKLPSSGGEALRCFSTVTFSKAFSALLSPVKGTSSKSSTGTIYFNTSAARSCLAHVSP